MSKGCDTCKDYGDFEIIGLPDDFWCKRFAVIKPKVTAKYGCYMWKKKGTESA